MKLTLRNWFRHLMVLSLALPMLATTAAAQEYLNGIQWPKPPVIQAGKTNDAAPSDAIVLFDGQDASAWANSEKWSVADGALIAGSGVIQTKQEFGDCQLHIEWSAPTPPTGSGQGRGNSGVFMMGRYEIQVLDSYDNETYYDGQAGAIYKQTPPMVNAMRAPGEWNTYDIFWTAPRFNEDGTLQSPAFVTLVHNGVLVLNHFQLLGDTPFHRPPRYEAHPPQGPISLQDHGNPVRFRNIWIREIKPIQGEQVREPFLRQGDKEIPLSESGN
jgi:hypothetical protein